MKSFPFEFFRSRFRRKSLKKFGDVNEEPLHILPSNGGRTDGVFIVYYLFYLGSNNHLYNLLFKSF